MSDEEDGGERALVPAGGPPPMKLASSMEAARANEFLHIDRHGKVRSPALFKAKQVGAYAFLAACSAYILYAWSATFGLFGAAGAGLFVGWTGLRVLHARQVNAAARYVVHGRVDEAEALLRPLATARIANRRFRAIAWYNLGAIAVRKGRHDEALVSYRRALALLKPRDIFASLARYAEVSVLLELGHVDEARALWKARHGEVPEGEYLRVAHWSAELQLLMAQGQALADPEALHERVRFALGLTTGKALLALLAWQHHELGDVDQAWHLLREALVREDRGDMQHGMPRLYAWVEAHRDAALAAAPPDED